MGKSKELATIKDDGLTVNNRLEVNHSTNSFSAFPTGNWAAEIYNQQDASNEGGMVVANRWAAGASTAFLVGGLFDSGDGFDEYLKVDGVGRVTMPYQPAFSAYHSSNIAYNGVGAPIQFNTTRYNVGNHYNTSTYKFTAPVAGKYLASVLMHYMGDGAYTYQFLRFRVNNADVGVELMRQGTKANYDVFGGCHIIHMNANDTLDVAYGNSGIDAGYFRSAAAFNSFEAMLIG